MLFEKTMCQFSKDCRSLLLLLFLSSQAVAQKPVGVEEVSRWKINLSGSISWHTDNRLPHSDHIEMSGDSISAILRYKVNADQSFQIDRQLVWPMLRTVPNNTHASLSRIISIDLIGKVNINGRPLKGEKVTEISLNGMMSIKSFADGIDIERLLFPSTEHPAFYESCKITNLQEKPISVEIPDYQEEYTTDPNKGVTGSYIIDAISNGSGSFLLKKSESVDFGLIFSARRKGVNRLENGAATEKEKRMNAVASWQNELVLETPDTILNTAFAFAKIRAAESIFKTAGGYMHGPGGGAYYAAIWANDQAEYIGPFFPFLGYPKGNEAALNAYLHFARFMNPDYHPIPSSIIAEGKEIWNGAGDRGDAAMIAYGAARYSLALGDEQVALKLWPLVAWCLEYNRRHVTADGVVSSDSDELEGRFPSGKANLCTSGLYYDALLSAAALAKELHKPKALVAAYQNQAAAIRKAIEAYFGRTVEGFKTYRYYDGNDVLRSWICLPLTVGIYDRSEGTVQALFSSRLWTVNGLATQAGDSTFWDRSTLYALRGVLQAGMSQKAMEFLNYYSRKRLLGEHVPYPVEAYPEGGQRHLSAESGLYCRIFTEGLFGIRPSGLKSFSIKPQLPASWDKMKLSRVHGFQSVFDLEVHREGKKIRLKVIGPKGVVSDQIIANGSSATIRL